jgi:hypothetical protein
MRIRVMNGFIELPDDHEDCEVIRAFDALGNEYRITQTGKYVELFCPYRKLNNGEIVEIVFKQSLVKVIEEVKLEYLGNGFYRAPGVRSDRSNIEGVTDTASGDIVGIDSVFDSASQEIAIVEYRNDTVFLKDEAAVRPVTAFGVRFIKPFKFFVLSQDLDEDDEKLLQLHKGSAIATFPYKFDVSEGDVITVLSGTQTKKIVLKRREADPDDKIQEFFVHSVPYLASSRREYREGVDFIIVGANKIHWICEDPPEANANMSITYRYFPTYRVFMNVPVLRTSENQQIPRKVVLQLLAAFNESRKVNSLTGGMA